MRNLLKSGRFLWIGVLFFATTAALCVDAEAQNQRTRRSGNRPTANNAASRTRKAPTTSEATAKPSAEKNDEKETKTPSEETAQKPTAPISTPDANDEAGTTTLKKETVAAVEGSDGEELPSLEAENNREERIAKIKVDVADSDPVDDKYSNELLDPTATQLPPGYRGHNIKAINKAIMEIFDKGNVSKDEYEKTSAYRKRIATFKTELPTKSLYGELTFDSCLALALLPAKSEEIGEIGVQTQYDADAEKFRIVFNDNVDYFLREIGDSRSFGIKFSDEQRSSKTYIGENLYGVKKEIRESHYVSHGVIFTDSIDLALDNNECLCLQGIAPNEAKEIGDSLGVLCVFKLLCVDEINGAVATPNCQVVGWWQHEATMRNPYEFSELQIAVRVTIPEFWVYNFKTGQVFAKYSLKDLKTGKAKSIGDFDLSAASKTKEKESASDSQETDEEKAEREARETAEKLAKERRRSAAFWQDGNKREENRLAAVKRLTPSREVEASTTIAVPGDCATLQEALDEAAKHAGRDSIPRIVLDAGKYDASGLTLKTFVDIQSATGNAADVILNVGAAPIVVDAETVVEFDGVSLRRGGKSGACVEVKRGIALFFRCDFVGESGAKSAVGVKAVGYNAAAVLHKCRATGFSLSALHVEDGAFGWTTETVFGPKNRFGASAKAARLEVEKCEFRKNETALYFRGIASGGAQENVYAENKRDAQLADGAKVEIDAPNVVEGK